MVDRQTILALAATGRCMVERLSRQLGKPIDVDCKAFIILARIAINRTDGEDYMRDHALILVDDMIRRDPEVAAYKYEYEPADTDEKRLAAAH